MNVTDLEYKQVSQAFQDFKWYNSSSLPVELQFGIARLELPADMRVSSKDITDDVFVTGHIVCNQVPILDTPISTHFSHVDEYRNSLVWDCVLSFPIKVRDLSLDAVLVLTAWTSTGKVVGGTTMNLFSDIGCLRRGKQKLMFYFDTKSDANVVLGQNQTPGSNYELYKEKDYKFVTEKNIDAYKRSITSTLANPNGKNDTRKSEWLDRLTLMQMESRLTNDRKQGGSDSAAATADAITAGINTNGDNWGYSLEEFDLNTFCYLIVEMPVLPYDVLHEEKQYQTINPHVPPLSQSEVLRPFILTESADEEIIEFSILGRPFDPSVLTFVVDWDMDEDNLCEDQHRRLKNNTRRGNGDSTAKPNLVEKERLDKILSSVVHHTMSVEEADLMYRFRYSLTENKKALLKFLFAVNWEEESEVAEIPLLLSMWRDKSPIDVADALKLLSREKSFEHPLVRGYAVEVLRSATNDELLTFLLQLVQALRFEPTVVAASAAARTLSAEQVTVGSSSAPRTYSAEQVAAGSAARLRESIDAASNLSLVPPAAALQSASPPSSSGANDSSNGNVGGLSPLASFLIDRACSSATVANYLYWYLKVEMDDENAGYLFQGIFDSFIVQLSQSGIEGKMIFTRLCALDEYMALILQCQRDARTMGNKKPQKEEALRKLLDERQLETLPGSHVDWVPNPLHPNIKVTGLVAKTASMFASAIYPCVIEFFEFVDPQIAMAEMAALQQQQQQQQAVLAAGGANGGGGDKLDLTVAVQQSKKTMHKIMFKSGDDLRQDQLIMQMISLMDSLLKKVNLDLKLLTYGILAVGQKDGIMEFVSNSMPISAILKNFGSITDFLRQHNPDKSGPYEIDPM